MKSMPGSVNTKWAENGDRDNAPPWEEPEAPGRWL